MLPLLIAIPTWPAVKPPPPLPPVERRVTLPRPLASGAARELPATVDPLLDRWASPPHGVHSDSSIPLASPLGSQAIPDLPPLAYPYISVQGGLSFADSLNGLDLTAMQSPSFRFNTGGKVEMAVGYQFANHKRLEVSAGYLKATPSSLSLSSQGVPMAEVDAGGELGLFTATVNGIAEFPIRDVKGRIQRLIPYVGAGLGYGNLSVPHCAITSSSCLTVNPVNTMAYQFKGGLSYRAAAKTSLFLEGGYVGTLDTTFSNDNGEITYNRVGVVRLNLGLRQGF
jgi:opacity protein-like surface antigen